MWIIALLEGVCGNYYNDVNGDFIRVCWSWGAGFIMQYYLVFHIPIRCTCNVFESAMAFTTLSGVISHYREGNVVLTMAGLLGDVERLVLISVQKIGSLIPGTSSSLVYSWDVIFICNFYVY